MKNKKLLIITLITILLLNIICINSLAVGWADMEDENTNQNVSKQENKQEEKPYDYTLSTNNYLKSLSVEGYKITPSFDKQTVNYEIKEEIKVDSVKVSAEPEDERAQVIGIGNIKVDKDEIEVNVIAESGTYKTYFIKLNRPKTVKTSEENVVTNTEVTNTNTDTNLVGESKELSLKTVISIVVVLLILGLIFAAVSRTGSSKKGKRSRR